MPNSKKHCLDCNKEMSGHSEHELCGGCRRDRACYMPSPQRIARMTAEFREQRLQELVESSPKIYRMHPTQSRPLSIDE